MRNFWLKTFQFLFKRVGVKDEFGQSGKSGELMAKYGLTAEKFISEAIKLVETKKTPN